MMNSEPLSELHLSAIGEAMNQMMGSAATSMSSMFNRKIDISPPTANVIETYSDTSMDTIPDFLKNKFVLVAFRMQIGDLIDSEIMQLYPIDFDKGLLKMFTAPDDGTVAPQSAEEQQVQLHQQKYRQQHSRCQHHSRHLYHSRHQYHSRHSRWDMDSQCSRCRRWDTDSQWAMPSLPDTHHSRMSMYSRQHSNRSLAI